MSIAQDKKPVVQYAGPADRWDEFQVLLSAAFKDEEVEVDLRLTADPSEVDYMVYSPSGPIQDFTPFTKLKAVLSLWAGVEAIIGNPTLKVPLCRMVDPGLTAGMVEWVIGHVMRYHLNMDNHILNQDGVWRPESSAPLASSRRVGILGMGQLGTACATTLNNLGFAVHGWSKRLKSVPGVTCYSGQDGLHDTLRVSDILVLLLPDTPDTNDIIDAETLAMLPPSARLLNPGRGTLVDDDALLAALDMGHVAHATLDVFKTEPLPADHRYWSHPSVTVTPHIAAETRAETSSVVIAQNVKRGEAGEPLLHQVDMRLGY